MKFTRKNKTQKKVFNNSLDKSSRLEDIVTYLTIFKIAIDLFNGISRWF